MRIFVGARLFDGFGWRDDCALATPNPTAAAPSASALESAGENLIRMLRRQARHGAGQHIAKQAATMLEAQGVTVRRPGQRGGVAPLDTAPLRRWMT